MPSGSLLQPVSTEDWQNGGFGVYVHWPFCAAKCPYCDFNSHVRAAVDQDSWRTAMLREIRHVASMLPGRTVTSVFFGGGTPSLMPPATVGDIIDTIGAVWHLPESAEITLEANPTSVEADKFARFRSAGVNRLSMGVQALNDPDLKRLGRMHSVAEAITAFEIARSHFDRVSFDLIYARQDQSIADWQTELTRAIDMAVDHFSLYQLTIEAGTRFGELASRGKLRGIPKDDVATEMYLLTQDICDAAGLGSYEVSNHARPGSECRHNLVYWNYGDYAGIGPGAHGRITLDGQRYATENHRLPETWLEAVYQHGHGIELQEPVTRSDQATECMLMGLRLDGGVNLKRYEHLSGHALNVQASAELQNSGHLEVVGGRIRATTKGRPVLNYLLKSLLEQ